MRQHSKLLFVTHNKEKADFANSFFDGKLDLQIYDHVFKEIRSEKIEEIALERIFEAYEITKKPTIIFEEGFFVEKLNGFPGVYMNEFLYTIGIRGLIKLLLDENERSCSFIQCLSYYDGNGQPKMFYEEQRGAVAKEPKGENGKHDCFGIRNIFIPCGKDKVLAELIDDERPLFAEAHEGNLVFRQFEEWYIEYSALGGKLKETTLEENWEKACTYIKDNRFISEIAFETWIKAIKLIECSGESLIFGFIDDTCYEVQKYTVEYIRSRFEQIILDAYNCCTAEEYKRIEIRDGKK